MNFEEIEEEARRFINELEERVYVLIGSATCGRAAGSEEVLAAFERCLKERGLCVPVIRVGCIGLCYAEPIVVISKPNGLRIAYGSIRPEHVPRLVDGFVLEDDPCLELALGELVLDEERGAFIPEIERFEKERRLLLKICGYLDPTNLLHYVALGGYEGLKKALSMGREEIVEVIKGSGLRGRGGAGFPTGRKWELCLRNRSSEKYVIANGDEGDPGAFMDRILLESNPFQLIEGMTIAAYAIGAKEGFVYVRDEYPLAVRSLLLAIEEAERFGLLGGDIAGTGFEFRIRVEKGAGAFVSGEETALIKAIEGKRSEPEIRPPYPSERGLFGEVTLINNVKTFSLVPHIMVNGPRWFSSLGTDGSKGTALFALAGKINYTGLVEVPFGITIRTIMEEIGGGIKGGKSAKAVQIGGPSGGCIPEFLFDAEIDYDALRGLGSMMGSGGMIFMDEGSCMVDVAKFFLEFLATESCGKCTFCRIGTIQMLEIMRDITEGKGSLESIDRLRELCYALKEGSLCGLGRTAPNPVLTTLKYFEEEYREHILEKKCRAGVCKALTAYYIIPEKCDRSCEHCVLMCPVKAVKGGKGEVKVIDQQKCTKCGNCLEVCPKDLRAVVKVSPIRPAEN